MKAVRLRQGASVVCFPRRGFFFTVLSTVIRAGGVLSAVATSRVKRSVTSSLLKVSGRGFFMRSLFFARRCQTLRPELAVGWDCRSVRQISAERNLASFCNFEFSSANTDGRRE